MMMSKNIHLHQAVVIWILIVRCATTPVIKLLHCSSLGFFVVESQRKLEYSEECEHQRGNPGRPRELVHLHDIRIERLLYRALVIVLVSHLQFRETSCQDL